MKNPVYFSILSLVIACLLVFSCSKKKNEEPLPNGTEIADARTSGSSKQLSLDFLPGTETLTAITLTNRGASSSVHVRLVLDTAAVSAAGLNKLRENSYTLATLEYEVPADGSVHVPITINRNTLSIDSAYALCFRIAEVSTGSIVTGADRIIVKTDMRNRWDGRYRVTGSLTDYADTAYVFEEFEMELVTASPTQVKMYPVLLGIPAYLIRNGINLTYWSNFGPVFNFNPSTNKITNVTNHYGQPAANTRSAELDASGTNEWNSSNKQISVRFWMNQSSAVPTPPHHRVLFINTFEYIRSRY